MACKILIIRKWKLLDFLIPGTVFGMFELSSPKMVKILSRGPLGSFIVKDHLTKFFGENRKNTDILNFSCQFCDSCEHNRSCYENKMNM